MMRTMSVVDISMKIWADEHPFKTGCLSVLENTFDPNLQTYTLRMEYKGEDGVKYRLARAVSPQMLASAIYPHHYICSLLDEMFEELFESKSGTVRKEKKEMPPKFTFAEEIKSVTLTPVDNDVRLKMAKKAVVKWYNEHNAPDSIGMEDVYIVWFCKVLQNWKALAGTHHGDGMYYEITFDGNKDLVYFDAYKKWQNVQMSGRELEKGVC